MSDDGRSSPVDDCAALEVDDDDRRRAGAGRSATPLGLIAITPASRSTPLAFPNVRTTSPASTERAGSPRGRARAARRAALQASARAGSTPGSSGAPCAKSRDPRRARRSRAARSRRSPRSRRTASVPIAPAEDACGAGRRRAATPRRRSARSGSRLPQRPRHRQPRQRLVAAAPARPRSATQPEAVAEVEQPDDDRRARRGREDEPHRIVLAADRERVDLAATAVRPRSTGRPRACAPRAPSGPSRREVVRVVLHEGRPAVEAGCPSPSRPARARPSSSRPRRRSRSRRPSAAATAMPGSCASPSRSSKVSVNALNAARVEEAAQPGLDPRGVAQRLAPVAAARGAPARGRTRPRTSPTSVVHLRVGDSRDRLAEDRRRRSRSPRRRAGSAPRPCRPR